MQRVIEIEEGRSFNFKASAFTPIQYNTLFPGSDFWKDLSALQGAMTEGLESFTTDDYMLLMRISYTMIYQGLAPSPKQTEEQKAFLEEYPNLNYFADTFEMLSLLGCLDEIMELWGLSSVSEAEEKNPESPQPEK